MTEDSEGSNSPMRRGSRRMSRIEKRFNQNQSNRPVGQKTIRERQRQFDQSILQTQMRKIEKAERSGSMDFTDMVFSNDSVANLIAQLKTSMQGSVESVIGGQHTRDIAFDGYTEIKLNSSDEDEQPPKHTISIHEDKKIARKCTALALQDSQGKNIQAQATQLLMRRRKKLLQEGKTQRNMAGNSDDNSSSSSPIKQAAVFAFKKTIAKNTVIKLESLREEDMEENSSSNDSLQTDSDMISSVRTKRQESQQEEEEKPVKKRVMFDDDVRDLLELKGHGSQTSVGNKNSVRSPMSNDSRAVTPTESPSPRHKVQSKRALEDATQKLKELRNKRRQMFQTDLNSTTVDAIANDEDVSLKLYTKMNDKATENAEKEKQVKQNRRNSVINLAVGSSLIDKRTKSQMRSDNEDALLVPDQPDMIEEKKDKRSDFENTLANAMEFERDEAKIDKLLIKGKTRDKAVKERDVGIGKGKVRVSQISRQLTMLRKRLDKKSDENSHIRIDDDEVPKKKDDLDKAELARQIDQTLNYIYSVEEKRISRRVHKVQDLFESNPLMFDDSQVSLQLDRLRKFKQNADLLKSHVQIYEEQMEEQKRVREFMTHLIHKHKINLNSDEVDHNPAGAHLRNCNEDYAAYFTYKKNTFFTELDSVASRAPKIASTLIKYIIGKVTMREELLVLAKYINLLMPPKMQRVFVTKCKNFLQVDEEDPLLKIMVDENQFVAKLNQNQSQSSNLGSPRDQYTIGGTAPPNVKLGKTTSQLPTKSMAMTVREQSGQNKLPMKKTYSQDQVPQSLREHASKAVAKNNSGNQLPILQGQASLNLPPKQSQDMTTTSLLDSQFHQNHQSKEVGIQPRMVEAYNMVYVLTKIQEDEVKQQLEGTLVRYLRAQLRTMPRVMDGNSDLRERFANLEKLLHIVENICDYFTWELKNAWRPKKQQKANNQDDHQDESIELQLRSDMHQMKDQHYRGVKENNGHAKSNKKGVNFSRLRLEDIDQNDLDTNSEIQANWQKKARTPANGASPRKRNDLIAQKTPKVTFMDHLRDSNEFFQQSPEGGKESIFSDREKNQQLGSRNNSVYSSIGSSNSKRSSAVKQIVAMMAKQQLKKMVPQQVYQDCADVLNQAFRDKDSALAHEDRLAELDSRSTHHHTQKTQQSVEQHRREHIKETMRLNQVLNHESGSYHHLRSSQSNNSRYSTPFQSNSRLHHEKSGDSRSYRGGSMSQLHRLSNNRDISNVASSNPMFPQLKRKEQRSRNEKESAMHRSQQMLTKMKEFNRRNNGGQEQESTRIKVRQSVTDIMQGSETNQNVANHSSFVRKTTNQYSQLLSVQSKRRVSQSSIFSSVRSSSQSYARSSTHFCGGDLTTDRQRLRNLIRLCMNEDYSKAQEEEQERKKRRRNKATFTNNNSKGGDNEREGEFADQSGLAFRKGAMKALNQDKMLFKKIEMYNYVEDLRSLASKELYDFFEAIDPKTAPKNIKLLYFYFVGSRNLISEMTNESVATYKHDQMQPTRPEMRKTITGKGSGKGKVDNSRY